MKKLFKNLILLSVPLLTIGCAGPASGGQSSSSTAGGDSSSSQPATHTHEWSTEWSSDETNHWKTCSGCNEKGENATHTFGEWQTVNLGTYLKNDMYKRSTVKIQECSVCNYVKIDETQSVLPEIRFNFEKTYTDKNGVTTQQEMDFATKARSTDKSRPTVQGKIKVTNAGEYNTSKDLDAGVKVRGNQTAGFDKKGLQIKLDKKANLLGLNGGPDGKGFKKWVLLADAKDTTISRSALGYYMSKGVIGAESKAWAVNFTPVSVYLNDVYWGMYMLADQKEVKDGRIQLAEPEEGYTGVDIGYCFELDYYAKDEPAKDDGGDPTFSIDYDGINGGNGTGSNAAFNIESGLANSGLGLVKSYTMNSDITDSTAGENQPVNDSNSQQVAFIKNRLTQLFKILHQAADNKKAYELNDSGTAVSSSKTVRQVIEQYFDLNTWAEGFVINAMACAPDLGYSSFYMSYDNTPTGAKKLRFDNPWDFDSNFGNRRNFIEKPDEANTASGGWQAQTFDPYYMNRTANLWLQKLSKLDWFINDYVKPKWNAAKEAKVFENMLSMLDVYFKFYEGEYKKNFKKWTTTQASDNNVGSYFNGDGVNSGELRKPFVNVNERKDAQKETINWVTKRIAYLDGKWGTKAA